MKVGLGSNNVAKVKALKKIASTFSLTVIHRSTRSGVSAQPTTDEETMRGALNRAREIRTIEDCQIGIGLEGGITKIGDRWFLCNWGALVSVCGFECVSSGGHVMLPQSFLPALQEGRELGDIVEQKGERGKGAIALLTDRLITRQSLYEQLLTVLIGQYFYYKKRAANDSKKE